MPIKAAIKKFVESQHARVPAGEPGGGQFTSMSRAKLVNAFRRASQNKGAIATQAVVAASGVIASAVAGPVGGAIAAATARATIKIGALIKESGAKSFQELRNPEFQKELEKGVQKDLINGAIATAINSVLPIPGVGNIVAMKTSGKAVEALQKFQERRLKNG